MASTIALPYSMQLELTYGCNRRCYFCGILDVPLGQYRYMELELVQEAARQLKEWKPKIRLEFGTGGEPTLNPKFFEIVNALRVGDPRIQIMCQSNVEPWSRRAVEWIKEYYKAGGNFIVLNCYKPGLRELMLEALKDQIDFIDFYHGNDAKLNFYHYHSPKIHMAFVCEDLGYASETHLTADVAQRWINNQGGSTSQAAYRKLGKPMPKLPLKKKCSRVFREMILSWDGRVPLCCYDWHDRLTAGKFPDQSLEEIWTGTTLQLARQALYNKNRNFLPCQTCDYNGGFRLGFLKDPELELTPAEAVTKLNKLQAAQRKNWDENQLKGEQRAEQWLKEPQ